MDRAWASEEADSAARGLPRAWPFQHTRLAAFFAGVALLGILLGIAWLRSLDADAPTSRVEWVLAGTVLGVALLGLSGVIIHRQRILPLRWKETEAYLRAIKSESEKYHALMEGAADMLVLVDPRTGRLREWNLRARVDLGLPPTDDGALTIDSLVAPEDLPRLRAALSEAAPVGGPVANVAEIRLRTTAGGQRIADATLASIALAAQPMVLLALRDVTRQKEIEKELALRERLSSLGLLTAGVAHEINNPLEGIANYLGLASRPNLSQELRAEYLAQVQHGFERIRDLVRELLSFARPQTGAGTADLAQIVERASKLTAYSSHMHSVAIVTAGLESPIEIVGDAGRLEQVLFNLLLNAGGAMQGRGQVTIRARRQRRADGQPCIELTVEDEGPGIPSEHMHQVFDPFFSTKGSTGLGLSVSYGIVQAHGGTITAANRPGGGACFTIQLPLRGAA
jgi:PAS domain S-box-containing protein